MPELEIPIIAGVSAGAINAAYLAARRGSLVETAEGLTELWTGLSPEKVFRVGAFPLTRNVSRWAARLVMGGRGPKGGGKSLLDTSPLQQLLQRTLSTVDGHIRGIEENLKSGRLESFALSTLKYATSQTVTWVQGQELHGWERPNRIGIQTHMTVDHIMASAALPLIFPAIRLGGYWYGDGGIRLATPLAPAVHLGADRIIAISTRYQRDLKEANRPTIEGYPPPAQVAGTLMAAIFLDAMEEDAARLQRTNRLLKEYPPEKRRDLRPIELLVLRPSVDLGKLSAEYEVRLPKPFRFLTRGLGTKETKSPDFLSMLMFQEDYLSRLIEIGERDAEAQAPAIYRMLHS